MTGGERITLGIVGALFAGVLIVLYAPVVVVVIGAFILTEAGDLDWSNFGLQWFRALADSRQIIDALENTLIVGAGSVLLATIFGCATALYVHGGRGRGHLALQLLIYLPFLLPPLIVGLTLLIYFREIGLPTGLIAVIVGHGLLLLAVVFRTMLNRLAQFGYSQIEAALDLGARPLQVFRLVVLPQIASSLLASALLAFALSFDETLVSLFLVGDQNTLPIMLWAMMRTGLSPEVNALATLVLATSLALVLLAALRVRGLATSD
jgi:putative spermidine/putrescine transport system permease protein/spermidine/putrescine transport system permease protein